MPAARGLVLSVGLGLLGVVVRGIPTGDMAGASAASGLASGGTCADLQKSCPGYKNVMMFCCEQADTRKLNEGMCTRFSSNDFVCGGAAHMEKTIQSCCASAWSGEESVKDLFGSKTRLRTDGVINGQDAPIMVVGEDGEMEEYDEKEQKADEEAARKENAAANAPEANEPMAREPGTCTAKQTKGAEGEDEADEQWNEWCDKNCIPSKYGGLGRTACRKGDDTGAVGCMCKAFHGQPITATEYDEKVEKMAAAKEAAKQKKDAAEKAKREEEQAKEAAAATAKVVYNPKNPETCKGRTQATPDYWCVEICQESGSCPKVSCVCDGEDPNAPIDDAGASAKERSQ